MSQIQKGHNSSFVRGTLAIALAIANVLSTSPGIGKSLTEPISSSPRGSLPTAPPLVSPTSRDSLALEIAPSGPSDPEPVRLPTPESIPPTPPTAAELPESDPVEPKVELRSFRRAAVPGLTISLPTGWTDLTGGDQSLDGVADYAEASWLSPQGDYTLTLVANWHLTAPERQYGSYVSAPRDGDSEYVAPLPGGVLAQVIVFGPNDTLVSGMLAHAAFRLGNASYSVRLSAARPVADVTKRFTELLSTADFDKTAVPTSLLPQIMEAMNVHDSEQTNGHNGPSNPGAVTAVSYDRNLAAAYGYDYAIQYTNSDHCYLWTVPNVDTYCSRQNTGYGTDGPHFVNRATAQGGLLIPNYWNQAATRATILRSWLLTPGNGGVAVGDSSLKKGDVVIIGTRTQTGDCWGWAAVVHDVDTGGALVATHSANLRGMRYWQLTNNACGTTNIYEFVHIDAIQDSPVFPQMSANINTSPSTPFVGQGTSASFQVCGYSSYGTWSTNNLYVRATQGATVVEFPHASTSLSSGQCYNYAQSRSMPSAGWWTLRAGYDNGAGFQELGANAGVVNNFPMYVVSGSEIQVAGGLTLGASEIQMGSSTMVQFVATNSAAVALTDRFRVSLYNGAGTFISQFSDSGNVTLAASGGQYSYGQIQAFSTPGIYQVRGEHLVNGAWVPLLGDTSKWLRVNYPPPTPPQLAKGMPPYIAFAGEPVNTGSGNFVHKHTDLSLPVVGLPLDLTRFYNHLDASQVRGQFGEGWTAFFDTHVDWRSDKTALLTYPDGKIAYFYGTVDPANIFDMSGEYKGRLDEVEKLTRYADGSAGLVNNQQVRYLFNSQGKLAQVLDSAGNRVNVMWSANLISAVTHSSGVTLTMTYTGDRISRVAVSTGQFTDYRYDGAGNLISATDSAGRGIGYVYDGSHRITRIRDANSQQALQRPEAELPMNEYDAQGRVYAQNDPKGGRAVFSYSASTPAGNPLSPFAKDVGATTQSVYVDAGGVPITYTYNELLQAVAIQDARGALTTFEYDAAFNQIRKTDALGNTWRWRYDAQGRVISQTDPLGATWVYTLDSRGNRIEERNPLGFVRRVVFDENDNPVSEILPGGGMITRVFSMDGRKLSENNNGATTYWAYDTPLAAASTITDAGGGVSRSFYDGLGNRTRYIDPLGRETQTAYDPMGRPISMTDAAGRVITFTHDANGNLLSESDGMGNVRFSVYDVNDQEVYRREFDGSVWLRAYDPMKRLISETNPLGATITYAYDSAGNLIRKTDSRGSVTTYAYDLANRVISTTNPAGHTILYFYDAAGRTTSTIQSCDACPIPVSVETTSYDALGHVTSKTDVRGFATHFGYDRDGRLVWERDPAGFVRNYTYDARGNRVAVMDRLWNYSYYNYDLMDRLVSEIDRLGNVTTYGFDVAGRKLVETDARGGITRFQYDAADRPTIITDAVGGVTRYSYDLKGNRLSDVDAEGRVTRYAYDSMGRVISVTNARGVTERREWDAAGNLVVVWLAGNLVMTRAYSIAGDLLVEMDRGTPKTFTYDTSGRVVRETDWRGAGTSYQYDRQGHVVVITDALGARSWRGYDAAGNLILERNDRGSTTTRGYDLRGLLVSITDGLGNRTQYAYDAEQRRISATNARGFTTRYDYDAEGHPVGTTDALGGIVRSEYDRVGNRVVMTDARSGVSRWRYDLLNREIASTAPDGAVTASGYDRVGNRIAITAANGAVTNMTYDARNNLVQRTDPLGSVSRTIFDSFDQPIRSVDELGYTSIFTRDLHGRVIAQSDRLGNTQYAEFDPGDNLVREIDPLGHVTRHDYDLLNRRTVTTDTLGNATRYEFDTTGNTTRIVDARGNATFRTYDLLGRPVFEQDALGNVTQRSYDPVGNVLTSTDQLGAQTVMDYDGLNRVVRQTKPLGQITQYSYDSGGNVVLEVQPSGLTCYAYDEANRLIRIIEWTPLACSSRSTIYPTMEYAYDLMGDPISRTDPRGNVYRTQYDLMRRVVGEIDPLGNTTVYTYDVAGNLVAQRNAEGGVVAYSYDAEQRPIQVSYSSGNVATFTYDADGNRIGMIDWNGVWDFGFDELRRPTTTRDPSGQTLTRTYDQVSNPAGLAFPDGRRTQISYSGRNEPTIVTDTAGAAMTLAFDGRSLLATQTNPNNTYTRQSYDVAGRLIGVQSYGLVDFAKERYRAFVPSVGMWPGKNPPPDWINRMLSVPRPTASQAEWPLQTAYTYTLDAVSNRVGVQEYRATLFARPTVPTVSLRPVLLNREYSYDRRGQMLSSTVSFAGTLGALESHSTLYGFDLAQNRVAKIGSELAVDTSLDNPSAPLTGRDVGEQNTYDAADRQILSESLTQTTSMGYDRNGNRKSETTFGIGGAIQQRTATYNESGRPVRILKQEFNGAAWLPSTDIRYDYDGLGRRIRARVVVGSEDETETRYLWDGDTLVGLTVSNTAGLTTSLFVRLHGLTLQTIQITPQGERRFWSQRDGNGSVVALTDEEGRPVDERLYADYGEMLAGDLNVSGLSYTGQLGDSATGNYAFRWRDYDPSRGVWTTPDPYRGSAREPMTLNRYDYVRNNPINRADAFGLFDYKTGAVQYGDSWEMIATQWGTSVATLQQLNPWVSTPRIGDFLQLPACNNAQCQFAMGIRDIRMVGTGGTECGERTSGRSARVRSNTSHGASVALPLAVDIRQLVASGRYSGLGLGGDGTEEVLSRLWDSLLNQLKPAIAIEFAKTILRTHFPQTWGRIYARIGPGLAAKLLPYVSKVVVALGFIAVAPVAFLQDYNEDPSRPQYQRITRALLTASVSLLVDVTAPFGVGIVLGVVWDQVKRDMYKGGRFDLALEFIVPAFMLVRRAAQFVILTTTGRCDAVQAYIQIASEVMSAALLNSQQGVVYCQYPGSTEEKFARFQNLVKVTH